MKKYRDEIVLGVIFISISFILYAFHIFIFNDLKVMASDLTSQIAFIPIYVFLTSIIIEQLLKRSERAENLRRMNTLVGIFYSEIGNGLIKYLSKWDKNSGLIIKELEAAEYWNDTDCIKLQSLMTNYKSSITNIDMDCLKNFLYMKKDFMIQLMANPNLMEHESFTELLLSIFHLIEEFQYREQIDSYEGDDTQHILNDVERAYKYLSLEWVKYMIHLKKEYPYLHNLAERQNPYFY
ncbi:MAG: hypothetical protein ACM3X7_14380 [Solirubrobacterales bacterium]